MLRLNRTSSPEPTVYSGPSVPVTVASDPEAAQPDAGIMDDAEMVEVDPNDPLMGSLGPPTYSTLAEEPQEVDLDRAPTYTTIPQETTGREDDDTHKEDVKDHRSETPTGPQAEKDVPEKVASETSPPAYDGSSDTHVDEKKTVEDEKEPEPEVPSDVLIETIFEEILNNYSAGGPFVRRLRAYRTPSGEIAIREEKIKIEVGTKLEMSPFTNSRFYRTGAEGFSIVGDNYDKIELSRSKATKKEGIDSHNYMGPNQTMGVGNKSVATYFGKTMSYTFEVDGWKLKVGADGSILSSSKLPASSTSSGSSQTVTQYFEMDDMEMPRANAGTSNLGRDMEAMGQGLAKMDKSLNRDMANLNRDMANMNRNMANMNRSIPRPVTQTFSSRGGRQINYSGSGTQFINTSGSFNIGGRAVSGTSMTFDENHNLIEMDGRRV